MSLTTHIFATPQDTARAVVELILAGVKEKTKLSQPFYLAVSGGSTPKLLFELLANEYADSIAWHFVRFFWVDERCVPPTHSESNFGMTYESLLEKIDIPETSIFRMQGENDPENEVKRYEDLLVGELPLHDNFPQFDLILLGMGDDGHTASIFPNDMSLLHSSRAVAVGVHPVSGQKRITLTGKTICTAKRVTFLVTGESKSEVLRQIIKQEPEAQIYPAAHVHSINGEVDFYLDQKAGTLL